MELVPPSSSLPDDRDCAYRDYIADLVLEYVSERGQLDAPEAYRRVMQTTDRTLTTVKNWLTHRVNFPDVASLARIVQRWQITPAEVFPPHLEALLAGLPAEETSDAFAGWSSDHVPLPLHDPSKLDQALLKYTTHPKSAVYVRQSGTDMLDQIRPDELMLIDPSCEEIRAPGMYLLKFAWPGETQITCVRNAKPLMSEPAVQLSMGTAILAAQPELVQLLKGRLPSHITVLGRVVGVLRQV
jgi:hypothetical protein